MPKFIKTRTTTKDIKAIDKAANLGGHMKNSFIRSKRSAESTQDTGYNSPTDYATDNVSSRAEGLAQDVAHRATGKLSHPFKKAHTSYERAKGYFREAGNLRPKARKRAAEQAQKTANQAKQTADTLSGKAKDARKTAEKAKTAVMDAKRTLQQTRQAGRQSIQTAKQTARTGKTVKATGKGTIKTVKKSVKTAERTAHTTIKTAKRTAKTAHQTAKATARAARIAAQASRAAARAAVVAAKIAVKATLAMIKAAILAIKGLVAIIAAGGWVVILIIIIICLIGLLVGSIFGIFFSGEDSGTGLSMPSVVSELTDDFYDKIEDIKSKNTHDVLDENDMYINWKEVLAVYTVKVNTDPDNAAEVATLDDDKIDKLRGVLNDMVTLSHSLKTTTETRTATSWGEEITEEVTITILTITLTQKSADDMAERYAFSQTQKDQLQELLNPEYDDLWAALLGGYSTGNGMIMTPDGSYIPNDIFSWPMGEGFPITSRFGYRKDPFTGATKYHGGVDISAPLGTPILAAADGIVTVANSTDSWGGGYGYYVKMSHDGGYATVYAHCSQIAVRNGQEVKAGEVIAYVGSTGRSTGNHLHFEVHLSGTKTDPIGYFK